MKSITLFSVAAVLLLTGTASADLMVNEYVVGEKVTLDDVTGYYWYWNLPDFVNMIYDEQISAVARLGTYGHIAGGWHIAEPDEMQTLWDFDQEITDALIPEGQVDLPDPLPSLSYGFWGRYESSSTDGTHNTYYVGIEESTLRIVKSGLPGPEVDDVDHLDALGVWVVTQQPIVPAPGAIILAVTGLLSSTLGLNRLRRKRKEPSQI